MNKKIFQDKLNPCLFLQYLLIVSFNIGQQFYFFVVVVLLFDIDIGQNMVKKNYFFFTIQES